MGRRVSRVALATAALGLGSAVWLLPRYLRAASVLSASAGLSDPTGVTEWMRGPVRVESLELTAGDGPVPVRTYLPVQGEPRGEMLLLHGIHPGGIEEARFVALARAFAAVGFRVWTPLIPELAALSATPASVARLRFVAEQMQARAGRQVVGMGISVGGGLMLLAAARPPQPTPFKRVVTVGAHHDLVRVARHYAGDIARDTAGALTDVPPNPYGLWVLARAHAERIFGADDVPAARAAIAAWIDQDSDDGDWKAPAAELSAEGRAVLEDLRQVPVSPDLQARLLAAIDTVADELRGVSPVGRLHGLRAQTLLLHGMDDPVVPPTELSWLQRELPEGLSQRALVTPVLSHAEFPEGKPLGAHLSLLRFVAGIVR